MNKRFENAGRAILKELLYQLTEDNHTKFKRMYCPSQMDYSIDESVNAIEPECIDWAITQCENSLPKSEEEQ